MTGEKNAPWAPMLVGPIVVGVDESPNAAAAAEFAQHLARRVGAECRLIHATGAGCDPAEAGERVRGVLGKIHPLLGGITVEVDVGPTADVLIQRAVACHASLIVVGGKHHPLLRQWMAGSTAVAVARHSPIPVLVTRGAVGTIAHVLVGADATPASFGAIRAAEQWADLWMADLRVVHAVPIPPVIPEYGGGFELGLLRADAVARAEETIWPLIGRAHTGRVVEIGSASRVLGEQARCWQAGLLVVARHDRGWLERMVIGSVTERLLEALPTNLLVVPATKIPAPKGAPIQVPEKAAR